jgi:hypothetical protein
MIPKNLIETIQNENLSFKKEISNYLTNNIVQLIIEAYTVRF